MYAGMDAKDVRDTKEEGLYTESDWIIVIFNRGSKFHNFGVWLGLQQLK